MPRHEPAGMRRTSRARAPRRARGFTLLETMLTLIIVAIGVAGVFDAYTSFVTTNTWSTHSATGTFLASEIRELSRRLPKHDSVTGLEIDESGSLVGWGPESGELGPRDFDDLDDFDGLVFAYDGAAIVPGTPFTEGTRLPGPIDATGEVMDDFSLVGVDTQGEEMPFGWSQEIEVEKLDPFDFSEVVLDAEFAPAAGGFPARDVDEYPLRVTVTVWYRDPAQPEAQRIAWVRWVVP